MITPEIAIADTDIWPSAAIAALQAHWLTTAQQIVALAATEKGINQLSNITRFEPEVICSLVAKTRMLLPAQELHLLEAPVDTRALGLGAADPDTPQ